MPRRKKNGQSPARVPGGPSEGGSLRHNTGYRLPQGFDGAMANNFLTSTPFSSSDKEKIVRSMREMFSHLDPEVIYIVLSESDFKVENAMDSLLELSVAADVATPAPRHVSGFERTAAALLSPCHFSEPRPDLESSEPSQLPSSSPTTNLLTEELDLLVDQELETLTAQQGFNEDHSSQYSSVGMTLPSVPQPSTSQQVLPELLQSSLVPGSRGPFGGGQLEQTSCPLNQPSLWEDKPTKEPQSVVDFTHLMTETPADKTVSPLDLASSGRSSAFQVYRKQDPSHNFSDKAGVMPSEAVVRGASSKVNQEPLGYSSSQWNLQAPVFSPHLHGNQVPAFIIPVAQSPSNWSSQPRQASPWQIQAPLKPFASVPKSWSQSTAPHPPTGKSRLRLEGRLLVLLRGAPGSGKTTLAKALLEYNPGGVVLSTDDYFIHNGAYQFDPTALGEAHHWNYQRAKEAFEIGVTPIIIDNTNMQGWEMKPYVAQAQKSGYKVLFREPDTWWKNKPRELERRTTHCVPMEKIRRMLNNYERNVTIGSIMGSRTPEIKQRFLQENTSPQPASETARPDLVGQPGSTEEYKKSHPELCSSLPDVSSTGRSNEVGILEDGSHKSTESLNFQPTGRLKENPEPSNSDDDIDMGELDSELDTQVNHPIGDERIPDCIVESVMSEDYYGDEIPVAFSESIAQRVRRERPSRRSCFERLEPADLVKDTNQSDSQADEKEKTTETERVEMARSGGEKEMMLDFVGHWPCDVGSLEQRQTRIRQRQRKEDAGVSEAADKTKSKPNVTELQKLLDFIQTGVADLQTGSSRPSSFSQSSGEDLEKDEEACGLLEESHGSRSNSEERVQNMNRVDSSRDDLPDCVLDWKAAESCMVMESRLDIWDGLQTESETRAPTGGSGNILVIESETDCVDFKATSSDNLLSDPTVDSLVISEPMEANVCHEGVESLSNEGEDGTGPAAGGSSNTNKNNSDENGRASRAEPDGSNIGEECQSPVCDSSIEAESSAFSGGSQERKQRQGRRSGKQCKLALTFTQNCPASSPNALECPSTLVHSVNTDVEQDVNPNWSTSLVSDSTEAKSEAHLEPPPSLPLADTACPTQTEPHDFALLWRLNHQDSPDDSITTACSHPRDITVLSGDSCRFVPELSSVISAAAAVHPCGHREVPYHMVHEKGTQVEEKELGNTQDRLESLRILSRHFKLVSFDTLEDLYDKCHQDLEWTTNLLLDSGERFFRDDGDKEEEDDARGEDVALSESAGARLCSNVVDEKEPTGFEEATQQSASGTVAESDGAAAVPAGNKDRPDATSPLKTFSQSNVCLPHEVHESDNENKVTSEAEGCACGGSSDDRESRVEMEEEMANMDEVHRLLQAELEDMEREQKQKKEEERTQRRHVEERRSRHVDIQSVELKLPTEVALQLIELFGPIGVDLGTCSTDDYAVQMDLNLAKLLHQKWKETIQEKKKQARLSSQESSAHWGESQAARSRSRDRAQPGGFLISADGYASLDSQPEAHNLMPLMDHWNVSRPHVSLRDIIKEEQALQENVEKTRQSRDGAALLKENQLYSLFPSIDRHFLQDIFRDHNYSLTQTELFLRSLLEEEPVKTVVAPDAPRPDHVRAASKEREKRQKPLEPTILDYQDTEDPEYEDFRAEANQQRKRQLESFSKAAEAYNQGCKDVASFYAQQGHLHGQRMREANHRAAVQIFQRVNSSLLPRNILDLHGLHVDEALEHLAQVLHNKSADCEQGLCRPQLSVITGRGNHSQGGVARIRPAVIDYLTSKHYRFTEPKPGHVLVCLK